MLLCKELDIPLVPNKINPIMMFSAGSYFSIDL